MSEAWREAFGEGGHNKIIGERREGNAAKWIFRRYQQYLFKKKIYILLSNHTAVFICYIEYCWQYKHISRSQAF